MMMSRLDRFCLASQDFAPAVRVLRLRASSPQHAKTARAGDPGPRSAQDDNC
jgi:hypothetical protein